MCTVLAWFVSCHALQQQKISHKCRTKNSRAVVWCTSCRAAVDQKLIVSPPPRPPPPFALMPIYAPLFAQIILTLLSALALICCFYCANRHASKQRKNGVLAFGLTEKRGSAATDVMDEVKRNGDAFSRIDDPISTTVVALVLFSSTRVIFLQ